MVAADILYLIDCQSNPSTLSVLPLISSIWSLYPTGLLPRQSGDA